MATQQLIYESAVPVSFARHGDWSIEGGAYFGFSRKLNAVPLMAVEFSAVAAEYVIIFAEAGEQRVVPCALLGMRNEENLYLGADGGWKAKYVPAFLRRYPYVFSSADEGKTFRLCIDEAYAGFNRERRGQAIFAAERKPSAYTEGVLKFLQHYQAEFQRSEAFCRRLKEADLLVPMKAQVSLKEGARFELTGFQVADRARLKALAADRLHALAQSDELELVYNHLHSMHNFSGMRERLAQTMSITAREDVAEESAPAPEARRAKRPGGKERKPS